MGKSPDPSAYNQPTPQERSQADVAMQQFNEYLKGKPLEQAYLKDVEQDPASVATTAEGQASADLAQLTPTTIANPNGPGAGLNVGGMARLAGKRARIMGEIGQDAVSKRAAGEKGYVENAMGLQSTADTALSGMASDAVKRNLSNAEADYESSSAGTRAVSSLAGAAAGTGMALYDKKGAA